MVGQWLYGAAAASFLIGSARLLFLLMFRVPVPARVTGTDLNEMERSFDADMRRLARFDGIVTRHDFPRAVLANVVFEIDGVEHRAEVHLLTRRGAEPDMCPVIWYDPSGPARATGIGPAPALMLLLAGGALAVAAYGLSI